MAAAPGARQLNQPTAEIYQVAVDDQYPYRVYGAQQDNTTVIVPSLPLGNGQDFRVGPGCETGPIIPDVKHPDLVYGSCKGQFSRLNLNTTNEERYWIGAQSLYGNPGGDLTYRFQRVSPMEVSPHDTAHRLLRLAVRAPHPRWRRPLGKDQPDLTAHPEGTQGASGEPITRDATGEEVYSTLYSIRESHRAEGRHLDGLQRRPDLRDARRRQDLDQRHAQRTRRPADASRISSPAPHKPGTAYVAIYRYLLGDFTPYIYRTDDFGKTWTLLTDGKNGIAADEPTRVVREDPDRAGLLYAGTEFGMYISFDNGAHWQSFQLNLPVTPVTDIKVAHKDLVLSTQGRSFWILDNLTPLHQIDDTSASAAALLFTPRDAIRTPARGGGRGATIQYPLNGAAIDYYVGSAPAGDISMEILDASGKVIRKFTSAGTAAAAPAEADAGGDDEEGPRVRSGPTRLDKTAGMHRFTWDLRYPGAWMNAARPEGPNGPVAVPGKFSVRLTVGTWTATKPFTVIEDPRITKSGVTTQELTRTVRPQHPRARPGERPQSPARPHPLAAHRSAVARRARQGQRPRFARDHALHPLQQTGARDPHHLPLHRDQFDRPKNRR